MGACFSSDDYSDSTSRRRKPSANVVSVDGKLHQYLLPITVSQVLGSETLSPKSFFLCNSDRLRFEDYIPSLKLEEELEEAQIYFMMPASKLKRRLAATEMAALAVKASVALSGAGKESRRSTRTRISPVLIVDEESQSEYSENASRVAAEKAVGSRKKLQRYYARRAKMAAKSFKKKLSTIDEGSEALD